MNPDLGPEPTWADARKYLNKKELTELKMLMMYMEERGHLRALPNYVERLKQLWIKIHKAKLADNL